MEEFAAPLALRVVGTLMDLPPDVLPGFQAWATDLLGLLAPIDLEPEDVRTPDDELVALFERVYKAYRNYSDFVARRRADPGEDLCSAMLALTDDDGRPWLSDDDVLAHMVGTTAAGVDTTANFIISMVRAFTQDPDQLALVLGEPALWDNAVVEGLRRFGPAHQLFRIAKADTSVAGVTIPAGQKVALSLAAANADPAQFPDPLRFDVRRANAGEHLAFGRGRHYCLGAPLAPPEARIALEALYRRLPNLRADLDQELRFVPSLVVRGVTSQRVTWDAEGDHRGR
jgi:cytochrome P450